MTESDLADQKQKQTMDVISLFELSHCMHYILTSYGSVRMFMYVLDIVALFGP